MRTVLAVDGGNSKTDLAVVAEDGTVLATGRTGPFKPQSDGVSVAADVVEQAASALLTDSGVPCADLMAGFLAGADLPEEEDALRAEFSARPLAKEVFVANDTFALLHAGASRPWGVAVVCGAGINAVGVSPTGKIARFPALGVLSGDWGGGEELAERIMWHAMRAEDGRGPGTALTDLVVAHFGGASVLDLVADLHFGRLDKFRLHELVPGLFEVAAAGDPTARSLVERQAQEVAAMAGVCLRRLDLLQTPTEIVLGGSVLAARDPLMHGLIEEAVASIAPDASLIVTTLPPIMGAILSGLDRLGAAGQARARIKDHFRQSAARSSESLRR